MKTPNQPVPAWRQRDATTSPVVSPPGSRNSWWMGECPVHGLTSHQTPFGCEACQRASLVAKGLVLP